MIKLRVSHGIVLRQKDSIYNQQLKNKPKFETKTKTKTNKNLHHDNLLTRKLNVVY
jgi:hypothetical protein